MATAIDTVSNKAIANIPIGQTTQALVYVPNAVPATINDLGLTWQTRCGLLNKRVVIQILQSAKKSSVRFHVISIGSQNAL